jgi:hypothetical protein
VQIDKQQIIDMLKAQGNHGAAGQADSQLPSTVDTEQHADILGKLGINPSELGGLGGLAGKLGI